MARKKKSRVRVIYRKQKINHPPKQKPDCPNCHRGVMEIREYVEVATEDWDEERSLVMYCPSCTWKD